MSVDNKAEAVECKTRGNAAFKEGDLPRAIDEFTAAIELDPENAVYYSNRSMVAHKAGRLDQALADGEKCVALRPDWPKAYSRKGAALFSMGRLEDAVGAYEEGLRAVPDDASLKAALDQTRGEIERRASRAQGGSNPFAALFGPDMWTKLAVNPETRSLVTDEEVATKLRAIQANPQLFAEHLSDPKVGKCIEVLLGMPGGFGGAGDGGDGGAPPQSEPAAAQRKPEPQPEPEPEPELTEEEKAEQEKKAGALAAKEAGNALFKKRKFDEAMAEYTRALEIDPTDGTFHNNRAAVHMMKKDYDACIAECEKAAEVANASGGGAAAAGIVAKALARKGTALQRMGRLEEALKALDASMVEKFERKVDRQRREIKAEMRKREAEAYLDPAKSEEHKAKGGELFKAGDYAGAIKEFDEALKRDPDNFKARSNRALCFTKIARWQPALDDCEKILADHPEFVKAYVRKGKIQVFLKQFDQAVETYQKGLEYEPKNAELLQCLRDVHVSMANMSEEDKERRAQEALKSPEIQMLMKDPMVHQAIRDLQSGNQAVAEKVMQNPEMAGKIQRLMAAGVLRTN